MACGGGFFRYKPYLNATYSEVRAVPAGYFSPEFQTCIIRCAPGGYCPQSVRKTTEVWNYTTGTVEMHYRGKCKFPSSVEKSVKPSLIDVNVTVDGITTTTQEETEQGHAPRAVGVVAVIRHRFALHERRPVHGSGARAGHSNNNGAAATDQLRLRPLHPL